MAYNCTFILFLLLYTDISKAPYNVFLRIGENPRWGLKKVVLFRKSKHFLFMPAPTISQNDGVLLYLFIAVPFLAVSGMCIACLINIRRSQSSALDGTTRLMSVTTRSTLPSRRKVQCAVSETSFNNSFLKCRSFAAQCTVNDASAPGDSTRSCSPELSAGCRKVSVRIQTRNDQCATIRLLC